MKRLTPICGLVALMSLPLAIDTSQANAKIIAPSTPYISQVVLTCARLGNLAEEIMGLRQNGLPLTEIMGAMVNDPIGVKGLMLTITKLAWDYPRVSSAKARKTITENYRNEAETLCITEMLENP